MSWGQELKKFDLGQTVSILANLGVIAGIVFLGIELRQTNELMDEQQRFNRLSISTGTNTLIAGNRELAELRVSAMEDLSQLTAADRIQLNALEMRVLRNWEWTFRELPLSELPVNSWRRVSKRPSWREIWSERKGEFDPEFERWIDEAVVSAR